MFLIKKTSFLLFILILMSASVYSKKPLPSRHLLRHNKLIRVSCGPAALLFICHRFAVPASFQQLCLFAGTSRNGTSLEGLARAARAINLDALGIQVDYEGITHLHYPAIAWVDGNHYIAVLHADARGVVIHDPNRTREEVITPSELLRRSHGILLLLAKKDSE